MFDEHLSERVTRLVSGTIYAYDPRSTASSEQIIRELKSAAQTFKKILREGSRSEDQLNKYMETLLREVSDGLQIPADRSHQLIEILSEIK